MVWPVQVTKIEYPTVRRSVTGVWLAIHPGSLWRTPILRKRPLGAGRHGKCGLIALDQVRQHLETLGLKQAVEVLDNTLDAAASTQLPYPETLAELLGAEVAARYERGSIILTSNNGLGEWGELMGDTGTASAILDRLLHHSHVLNIRGESYRLREKRHASLFPSQQHLGTGLAEASDNYRDWQNRWTAMNLPPTGLHILKDTQRAVATCTRQVACVR